MTRRLNSVEIRKHPAIELDLIAMAEIGDDVLTEAGREHKAVIAVAAGERVVAGPDLQDVSAIPANEDVVAVAGSENIIAVAAIEGVVAVAGNDDVVTVPAGDGVVALSAVYRRVPVSTI